MTTLLKKWQEKLERVEHCRMGEFEKGDDEVTSMGKFSWRIGRKYAIMEFLEDLKTLILKGGVEYRDLDQGSKAIQFVQDLLKEGHDLPQIQMIVGAAYGEIKQYEEEYGELSILGGDQWTRTRTFMN